MGPRKYQYNMVVHDSGAYSVNLFEELIHLAVDLSQVEASVNDEYMVQVSIHNWNSIQVIRSRISNIGDFDPFRLSVRLMNAIQSDVDWDIEDTYIIVEFFPNGP